MKVTVELPELPEGWEYTGEYRVAKNGECIQCYDGEPCLQDGTIVGLHHIIRKTKWTPEDGKRYWQVVFYCFFDQYNQLNPHAVAFKTQADAMSARVIGVKSLSNYYGD